MANPPRLHPAGRDSEAPAGNKQLDVFRRARGDVFWEVEQGARYHPNISDLKLPPYAHQYEGAEQVGQSLSTQMRELVAVVLLLAKGEHRFAANHVRRLYRLGVTDGLIMEAVWAIGPYLGFSNLVHAVGAIHAAKDPSNLEGELPAEGAPQEIGDFPELHLGRTSPGGSSVPREQVWDFIATIDPTVAEFGRHDYGVVYDGTDFKLPAGAREILAVVALCHRGLADLAAEHVQRALEHGATVTQLLEALSASVPMSGLTTLELGAEVLMRSRAHEERVALSATLIPRDGQVGRLGDLLTRMAKASRQEPGCLRYDVYLDGERGVYHLMEVYARQEDFEHHQATPHFESFRQESPHLLRENPTGRCLHEIDVAQ